MRTRVKICGITRVADAVAAVAAGADAIGVVFDRASARCITLERARAIADALPPFVALVGLFVDASPTEVRAALRAVPFTLLQFHGMEPPEQCSHAGRPYIKALRMRADVDVHAEVARYRDARAVLLDSYVPGHAGGSGAAFDWSRVPRTLDTPIILAGGLTPDNVGAAIVRVRPYAVDVSSGVETAPGIKDSQKIAAFIAAVRAAA